MDSLKTNTLSLNRITFIDTEIDPKTRSILDIGGIKDDGAAFHRPSSAEFATFLKGTNFI